MEGEREEQPRCLQKRTKAGVWRVYDDFFLSLSARDANTYIYNIYIHTFTRVYARMRMRNWANSRHSHTHIKTSVQKARARSCATWSHIHTHIWWNAMQKLNTSISDIEYREFFKVQKNEENLKSIFFLLFSLIFLLKVLYTRIRICKSESLQFYYFKLIFLIFNS